MREPDLMSVADCDMIFSNKNSVILSGKNPWIFQKDGTFIATYKHIRNAYEMVFLPDNTVLMNGAVDKAYHLISLKSGEVLWSCPQKGRRDMGPYQFAVAPDGQMVYFVYRNMQDIISVDCLDLKKHTCITYNIPLGLRATIYCYCDSNGYLRLLQSFLVRNEECKTHESFRFNGILKWHPEDQSPVWKHHWLENVGTGNLVNICNDDYILFENLNVQSLTSDEMFNLLENEPDVPLNMGSFRVFAYDRERRLLTLRFTRSSSNMIIDCDARKIAAHYVPFSRHHSLGCLIDNEFWMGSFEGVVKRPFPNMDPFPKKL